MRPIGLLVTLPVLGLIVLSIACDGLAPETSADAGLDATPGDAALGSVTDGQGGAVKDGDPVDAGPTSESDAGEDSGAQDSGDASEDAPTFRVSGAATYDYVNANDDVTQGGVKLDYAAKTARPIRRAAVFAMEGGVIVTQTVTNDSGEFNLDVPKGHTVTLRVAAQSVATANVADGIAPNRCVGASWDVKVVDNTQADAQYMLDDATAHAAAASGVALNAPMVHTGGAYVKRAAAPFAILDTIITEIELMCQGKPDVVLPSLVVKWSINNVPSAGDPTTGMIDTSHYARDPATGQSELRILGKEDVDTDEYDDHIIAHEFGHYLEDRLFRSDSVGGTHAPDDILDPGVAFGEGFGNALSGMAFNDPIYVDTSGVGQAEGATTPVNKAPTGDDRGIYSEASVQYMLWSLFDNRDAGNGSIDRIYNIFANLQKTTPGITSALTFAAYYNQVYGSSAEKLRTIWETDLATPFDALCAGTCAGTGDTADVFDTDNDIGTAYATTRKYPGTTGPAFSAEFWRHSRLLVDGTNAATGHDTTRFGGYAVSSNRLGAQRAYRYVSTVAAPVTISVGDLGASSCAADVLDVKVALAGKSVAFDQETTGGTAGCPSATFTTVAGATYTVLVNGQTTELPSYTVNVARKHRAPFTVAAGALDGVAEETDMALPIIVTPTKDATNLTVSVRGIDGVNVRGAGVKNAFRTRARGSRIAQPTIARVARGGAGWAVVDVSAIVDGRRVSASYPVPLRASNGRFAPRALGAISTDANGQRVELMQAIVR